MTGRTTAEIVVDRADAQAENMGLTSWQGNWNHYRPHAGLGGKMVKPYPQDMNAPVREVSFLGGLLHGYRREPMAA